jgi:aldehyde dehydrogenase (NAD+)
MVTNESVFHTSPIDSKWVSEIKYDDDVSIDIKFELLSKGAKTWQKTSYAGRAELFGRLLDALHAKREEINSLIRIETGKTKKLCESEFKSAVSMIKILTAYEYFPKGVVLPSTNINRFTYTDRTPFGIALLIFPSNAPLPNFIWKIAPALMAGNVVLAKPSPYTAKTFDLLMSLFRESGFGEEIIQKIDGEENQLKSALYHGVDLISFTGSTLVGKKINHLTSNNFPKLILECGGINPFFVFKDANLDQCLPIFIESAFGNSGQRCTAASLTLVEKPILNKFLEKLEEDTQLVRTGLEDLCEIGPMCSPKYVSKLNKFLEAIPVESVKFLGKVLDTNDFIAQPRIALLNSNFDSSLLTTEVYGPVSRIIAINSAEEGLDIVSRTGYGLTAAVWTRSDSIITKFKSQLKSGVINFNGPTFGSEPNFPFGGIGLSGNGTKDAGYNSIEEYSYVKVLSEFSYEL